MQDPTMDELLSRLQQLNLPHDVIRHDAVMTVDEQVLSTLYPTIECTKIDNLILLLLLHDIDDEMKLFTHHLAGPSPSRPSWISHQKHILRCRSFHSIHQNIARSYLMQLHLFAGQEGPSLFGHCTPNNKSRPQMCAIRTLFGCIYHLISYSLSRKASHYLHHTYTLQPCAFDLDLQKILSNLRLKIFYLQFSELQLVASLLSLFHHPLHPM